MHQGRGTTCTSSHCSHHYHTPTETKPEISFKNVLDEEVKINSFIRFWHLSTCLFNIWWEKIPSINIKYFWLSQGKAFVQFPEFCVETAIFGDSVNLSTTQSTFLLEQVTNCDYLDLGIWHVFFSKIVKWAC